MFLKLTKSKNKKKLIKKNQLKYKINKSLMIDFK